MWAERDIDDVNRWLRRTGVAPTRLGIMVCNNPNMVARLRDGKATLGTLRKLIKFIKKYPAGKK